MMFLMFVSIILHPIVNVLFQIQFLPKIEFLIIIFS